MIKAFLVLKFVYRTILRDLVIAAIDNPDSDIDDFVIKLLDRLFDYDS
ncbi:hypothetical protein LCGC14_1930870 [marine sediment metagenome]|uniref:Uncharacterized protein n=1 Tax=marine sediment metagenome TaxID=412755 RepID=A0A0F9FNM9_9ZZZZ